MSEIIPLYEQIISDIRSKIEQGLYRTGDKLDSLNQLCKRYGVSKITAIRALDELQDLGLIQKVAGKGSFVTGIRYERLSQKELKKLKKIILFNTGSFEDTADNNFSKQIYNSILSHAYELGIDFQTHNIQDEDVYGKVKVPFKVQADEAVIAIARNTVIPMLHLFTDPNARRVLIDTSVAGVPNVLSDNFHGMNCLVTHLKSLGHQHLLFAGRFSNGQNFVNENERLEAFSNITNMLGLKGDIVTSGNFDDIYDKLKKEDRPTAILFSRDDPAVKLINELMEMGIKVPDELSVVGYDDYIEEKKQKIGLTTLKVDTKGLAINAVDYLNESIESSGVIPLTKRVKGELVVRESCGKMNNSKLNI